MSSFLSILVKRARSTDPLDPGRDWLMMFISTVILFVGVVVWNAWTFDTVANGGVIGSPASSTEPAFNQSSLDTVHTIFANRAAEEAKYRSNVYHYTDPSQ